MFIEITANKSSISARKPIFGIGVNDVDYYVKPRIDGKRVCCIFYQRWIVMLQRCYSKEYQEKYPSYKGCSVCDEWLIFSNFKAWMINQDWKGKQLDKDIKFTGNKIYSPDKCIFVSQEINSLLTDCKSARGEYPKGVYFRSNINKYIAQCRVNKKVKVIGAFSSPKEAEDAYIKTKSEVVLCISKKQAEPLKGYLIRISNEIKNSQTKR